MEDLAQNVIHDKCLDDISLLEFVICQCSNST